MNRALVGVAVVMLIAGCGRRRYVAASDGGDIGDGDITMACGPTDGLFAYFPFGDADPAVSVSDASGNDVAARCDNSESCPTPVDGPAGLGYEFDHTLLQHIRVTPSVAQQELIAAAPGLTFSALVRLDGLPETGTTHDIVSKTVGPTENSFALYVDVSGQLIADLDLADSSGSGSLKTPLAFEIGEYAHVAMVWTGANGALRTYQNGAFSASSEMNNAEFDGSPIIIGADQDPNFEDGFRGVIDEVRIYTRALSDAEIEGLAACP